jgi:hypothetical protein
LCNLPKIWAQRKYCHLKPRWVKCAGDHLTNRCQRKERSSDVQCSLCGENYPANYKGSIIYKELQKRVSPPRWEKQCTPAAQIINTLQTQPDITYAQITKQNSYAATNIEREPPQNEVIRKPVRCKFKTTLCKVCLSKWELC